MNRAQIPGKKDHPGLNGLNGCHRTNITISLKGWGGERNYENDVWVTSEDPERNDILRLEEMRVGSRC